MQLQGFWQTVKQLQRTHLFSLVWISLGPDFRTEFMILFISFKPFMVWLHYLCPMFLYPVVWK